MKSLAMWTALGIADGAALGAATHYTAVWVALGAALGISAGLFARARQLHHIAETNHVTGTRN